MKGLRIRCAILLLTLWSVAPAGAQTVNATLLGTVTDSGGGVMAGAKVMITETNTGISHTGLTNESGNYTFPDIPPGVYAVVAEQSGFKRESRRDISVVVNSTARVDLQLQPGSVTETIEVTGAAALLQTDRVDTTRSFEADIIEELPLGVNRNFQSLLDLAPGTTPATFQHSQFFNAGSTLQTEVNGQMRQGNNYQIEGTDNNQRTGLLQILIPPAEAIQIVSISTSNHEPELGRGSGAIANVVLKSGTNAIHGGAYELHQNSALDARSFFNVTVGHLVYNRVGGNIGGPIKKNKLFFFTDYLRTMDREANTNQVTIPSMDFRRGDLSAGRNTVYDPATGTATGAGRTPFSGNIVPTSRINPVTAKILDLLPAPNQPFVAATPSNNYFALLPAQKTNDAFDVKIDDSLSERDRLSGRFSYARPVTYQASIFGDTGGPAQGAFQGSGFQKTYSSSLNYNRTITPTVLTEIRVGIAHYHNEAIQTDYGKDDATKVGAVGINISPFTSGMVGINLGSGFSSPLVGYSASLPWVRAEANIGFVNTWTKIAGNHTIKGGIDIRRVRDDLLQDQTFSPRGVVTFGTNQTFTSGASGGTGIANNMASFLLDLPSQVGRDINTYFPALRAWQVFSYVADNWRVSPKLSVNLGLRWEFYPPPTPRFAGGFSNYNFVDNTLVIAGVGKNPSNLGMDTHYKMFAPRLGLAYRLTNTTVLRSGFGISYTPFPDNTYAYNYPVRANNSYQPLSTYLPAVYPDGSVATFQKGFPALQPIEIPADGIIHNPDPTSVYYVIPKDWRNPYVEFWNFAVQQSLPFHFVIDATYVANHGVNSVANVNLNAGQTLGKNASGQPQFALGRTAAVNQYFRGFSSTYHSLQVKLDRKFATGLRMTTSFTWGKAMNFQSGDDGSLVFAINEQRNYSRADYDRTLSYVQSYIYKLPFGRRERWLASSPAGKVLGGWQVSGVLSLRTGTPLAFTANNTLGATGTAQTPNQIAPVEILHGINVGNPWFSTSSFTTPGGLNIGSVGRHILSGPGMFALNGAVSRTLSFPESRVRIDLRGEAFNLTNTPQFSNPSTSLTSATYGIINSTLSSGTGVNGTGGGRAVQFAVKIFF
jgi:hypothetical protein